MKIGIDQLGDRLTSLLPSQKEFVFAPEQYTMIGSGWGSGKSTALCLKALILSAYYPKNAGLIGRFNATDLEDSTVPVFFDICPPSWIKAATKKPRTVTLWNDSVIYFRHINDPDPKRRHITSMNLGWFGVDQAEELTRDHWNTLMGRLRLPRAAKRFGFGAFNPNGKDWIYQDFFQGIEPFGDAFYRTVRNGSRLAIAVRSEENARSNGGFVDDAYFQTLRQEMTAEWVARYLDCSFEDFSGRIYKDYGLETVHNITRFPIPDHWNIVVPIDVGGACPWAITPMAVDEWGNLVVFKEFVRPTVGTQQIAEWIKASVPWSNTGRTSFLIDWENRQAAIELREHKINCLPAQKAFNAGTLRVQTYLHVNLSVELPPWYYKTQPADAIKKFQGHGSPRLFIMRDCQHTRTEHDRAVYDETGKVKKSNTERFDTLDAVRYGAYSRPPVSKLPRNPRWKRLEATDPLSAREAEAIERRFQAHAEAQKNRGTREIVQDEVPVRSGVVLGFGELVQEDRW